MNLRATDEAIRETTQSEEQQFILRVLADVYTWLWETGAQKEAHFFRNSIRDAGIMPQQVATALVMDSYL